MFEAKNMTSPAVPRHGWNLMGNVEKKIFPYFAKWIPNSTDSSVVDIPPKGLKMAAACKGSIAITASFCEDAVVEPYNSPVVLG